MTFSIDNPEGRCNNPPSENMLGKPLRIGHIQIILSDHVRLKIRNPYIKLDFSATRPG